MRSRTKNEIDQSKGTGADQSGVALDALVGPVAIAPMRAWHVLSHGRCTLGPGVPQMRGDALAFVKDLDRRYGDTRLDLLA